MCNNVILHTGHDGRLDEDISTFVQSHSATHDIMDHSSSFVMVCLPIREYARIEGLSKGDQLAPCFRLLRPPSHHDQDNNYQHYKCNNPCKAHDVR